MVNALVELGEATPEDIDTTSRRVGGLVLRAIARGRVESMPLPSSGEICIGRGQRADIRFPELTDLSRRHALLRIREPLEVCDLGSANGTFVRGVQLTANDFVSLELREPFMLSDVTFVVQRERIDDQPMQVRGLDPVKTTIDNHLQSGARFGVVSIELGDTRVSLAPLFALLSRTDVAGIVSEHQVLLVLTGRSELQLSRLSSALERVLIHSASLRSLELLVVPRDREALESLLEPNANGKLDTVPPPAPASEDGRIIVAPAMIKLHKLAEEVSSSGTSLLLLGETGVGKDVVARAVHQYSGRSGQFVGLNCAALPEHLLESELFGHEKGAFTGAVTAKQGLLEAAEGGTVFLDEVGEMPLSTQAKLLRVLEERKVLRVGAVKLTPVNFRLIAATNRNLQNEMNAGRFRTDLYYRINGFTLSIPPLRERREEIEPLTGFFARRSANNLGKATPRFSLEAKKLMLAYPWPGNIRELRSVVERAVLLCRNDIVEPKDLSEELHDPGVFEGEITELRAAPARPAKASSRPKLPSLAEPEESPPPSLQEQLSSIEATRIAAALEACAGNQTRAAQMLGITRRALIVRLERYNLPRPRRRD